jgi:ATP-dependent Clp protease ATP-binding subunit ClpC
MQFTRLRQRTRCRDTLFGESLQPSGKPLATLLFLGLTGVGNSAVQSAGALLVGSAERMARFDTSEHTDSHAAERLIRGTDRVEGLLTRRVRKQPFGVILLDEIEKAHPAVFDMLLALLGERRLSASSGRLVDFRVTLVRMTSFIPERPTSPGPLAVTRRARRAWQ